MLLLVLRWVRLAVSSLNKEEELGEGPVFCFLFYDRQYQSKLLFIVWFCDDVVNSGGLVVIWRRHIGLGFFDFAWLPDFWVCLAHHLDSFDWRLNLNWISCNISRLRLLLHVDHQQLSLYVSIENIWLKPTLTDLCCAVTDWRLSDRPATQRNRHHFRSFYRDCTDRHRISLNLLLRHGWDALVGVLARLGIGTLILVVRLGLDWVAERALLNRFDWVASVHPNHGFELVAFTLNRDHILSFTLSSLVQLGARCPRCNISTPLESLVDLD